jgi:phenylacetate-CoA ligase
MYKALLSSSVHYIRILYYIIRLRRNQWIKKEKLMNIQEKRLRMIVDHAYHNVPYYQEMFDSHGIKPEDIRTVEDLKKLPITTKEVIQSNYPDKMITRGTDINQCKARITSGSTGRPLKICFGKKSMSYYAALGYYPLFEHGLRLTDKIVSVRPEQPAQKTWFQRLGILRNETVSMLQPVETIIETLIVKKPDVIEGPPSMLSILAKEIKTKNIAGICPRMIITQSETLTDHTRNEISDAFNAVIYDIYSSMEFSSLAFECKEHLGYHIISDSVIIESIKGDKNTSGHEMGEIVITGLFNFDMPFIRYKLGDIGILSNKKCNCGRGFPLLSSLEGRADDFIILPSGRTISPRGTRLRHIPGITEFRVIQEEKDRFKVQVVKGKEFSEDTISQIEKQVKAVCLGENVRCEVELVKEIRRGRTGKLRRIVSKVKSQDESSPL